MEDGKSLLHHLGLSLDQHQLQAAAYDVLIRPFKLALSNGIVLAGLESARIVHAVLIGALGCQLRCGRNKYSELADYASFN
jgi:hypothetical protein